MPAQDPKTNFCYRHAALSPEPHLLDDSINLMDDLFHADDGALNDTTCVSTMLTNVIILLGQGRISTRRAAVITYALSLLLRSLLATERQDAQRPLALDFKRPGSDHPEPAAGPAPDDPTGPMAAYNRLRP